MQFESIYFDGKSSKRSNVTIRLDDSQTLMLSGDDIELCYKLSEATCTPQLGNLPRQLRFPDGAGCELPADIDTEGWFLATKGRRIQHGIHAMESKWRFMIIAVVLAATSVWGLVQYGIPVVAEHAARQIPVSVETSIGEESLAIIDRTLFQPSTLPQQRQDELLQKFRNIADSPGLDVLFRHSSAIGANAFALPSGIIVFTDDMVTLATDDNELLAVFAHELGHVKNRHFMRHILQDSATTMLLLLLTGDVGSASSFAATIPVFLTQAKFSRDFEQEADLFAAERLQLYGIDPVHLGNLLRRLADEGKAPDITGFLSTHPSGEERHAFLEKFRKDNLSDNSTDSVR